VGGLRGQKGGLRGCFSPSAPAPKPHQRICRTHETISSFSFTGVWVIFPQLAIQLAAVCVRKVPALAGAGSGPALPRSPRVRGNHTVHLFWLQNAFSFAFFISQVLNHRVSYSHVWSFHLCQGSLTRKYQDVFTLESREAYN